MTDFEFMVNIYKKLTNNNLTDRVEISESVDGYIQTITDKGSRVEYYFDRGEIDFIIMC